MVANTEASVTVLEQLGSSRTRGVFFARGDNGWHGVRKIRCPKDCMRNVFIVGINPSSLHWRVRDAVKAESITRY